MGAEMMRYWGSTWKLKAVRELNDKETDGERREVELKIVMTDKAMELKVKMRHKERSDHTGPLTFFLIFQTLLSPK